MKTLFNTKHTGMLFVKINKRTKDYPELQEVLTLFPLAGYRSTPPMNCRGLVIESGHRGFYYYIQKGVHYRFPESTISGTEFMKMYASEIQFLKLLKEYKEKEDD